MRDNFENREILSGEPIDKIKKLLLRESGMYVSLRKMATRALEAILLNEDMEELLLILEEKQEVISQLQLLSDTWADAVPFPDLSELRGTPDFWEKLSELFPEEQAAELDCILAETRAAAEQLMEGEKKVQAELEKHVESLREKMLSMKHGRTAVVGYTKMGGGYLDIGS